MHGATRREIATGETVSGGSVFRSISGSETGPGAIIDQFGNW